MGLGLAQSMGIAWDDGENQPTRPNDRAMLKSLLLSVLRPQVRVRLRLRVRVRVRVSAVLGYGYGGSG